MSNAVTVGISSNAVLFGSQRACTLVNTGLVTVYLGEDSTVTAGVDYALTVGASIHYDDYATVWSVTDATAPSIGELQIIFDSEELSVPSNSGSRIVWDTALSATGAANGVVSFASTPSLVCGSVTVMVYAKTTTPFSGSTLSMFSITGGEMIPTLPTDTVPTDPSAQSGQLSQVHTASWKVNQTGLTTSTYVGQVLFSATFPNLSGSGYFWSISRTGSITTANFGVRVLLNQYAVPSTMVTNGAPGGISFVSGVLSANGTAAGAWTQAATGSPTYVAGSGTSPMSQAASTTTAYYLPTLSGPVRVRVAATQTGAGACTMTLYEHIVTSSGTTYPLQWDTALVTSAAAGSLFGAATYGVWPTGPMYLQITTAAGVSLSGLQIGITSGVQ